MAKEEGGCFYSQHKHDNWGTGGGVHKADITNNRGKTDSWDKSPGKGVLDHTAN